MATMTPWEISASAKRPGPHPPLPHRDPQSRQPPTSHCQRQPAFSTLIPSSAFPSTPRKAPLLSSYQLNQAHSLTPSQMPRSPRSKIIPITQPRADFIPSVPPVLCVLCDCTYLTRREVLSLKNHEGPAFRLHLLAELTPCWLHFIHSAAPGSAVADGPHFMELRPESKRLVQGHMTSLKYR